jgi:hypothetical protein
MLLGVQGNADSVKTAGLLDNNAVPSPWNIGMLGVWLFPHHSIIPSFRVSRWQNRVTSNIGQALEQPVTAILDTKDLC